MPAKPWHQKEPWPAVKVDFLNGMGYAELAVKHGLKAGTIRVNASRHGWVKERDDGFTKLNEQATEDLFEAKLKILREWNDETIREAKNMRLAARSLYMERIPNSDGVRVREKLSAAAMMAVASVNMTADKLVRLSLGVSTENQQLTGANGGPIQTDNQYGVLVAPAAVSEEEWEANMRAYKTPTGEEDMVH